MQQQTFNQQERELGQSLDRATPPGQSLDRAMEVDQGEAQREVESVAGGLDPSETGAGFGPTPAACGQTSEVASAPAPTHDSTAAKSKNPASGPAPGEPDKKRWRRPKKKSAAAAAA